MTLRDAILGFPAQLAWQPEVFNAGRLPVTERFLVAGMGGSNHATDLLKAWQPEKDIITHRSYGLPVLYDKECLVICCSYSGNTEETIDAYETAKKQGLTVAVISVGGELVERAKNDGVAYIAIPDTGIQPRSSLGFQLVALQTLMQSAESLNELRLIGSNMVVADFEASAQTMAKDLLHRIPLVYASSSNGALAHNWKIQINENAKIPAFANVFPELNHNEMNGFAGGEETKRFAAKLAVVMLRDSNDHPRITKRMDITTKLLSDRGIVVSNVPLPGETRLARLINGVVMASWVSLSLADGYGIDPVPVPLVEEFKQLMK